MLPSSAPFSTAAPPAVRSVLHPPRERPSVIDVRRTTSLWCGSLRKFVAKSLARAAQPGGLLLISLSDFALLAAAWE